MNLIAYDKVNTSIDKRKSWIDVYHKCLYTKQVAYRNYVCFGRNYDGTQDANIIYIIVLDDIPPDRASARLIVTNNGCAKIDIKTLMQELGLANSRDKYISVDLRHTEHSDDGDIYQIII